ncbi:MAG: HIT family protein [Patescibacteria group bacterium]
MCLFCKIIKKEIPAEIVYEDEWNLAILDINPRAPGHTMVIPKVHSQTILDLPEKDLGLLFEAVKEVSLLIKKSLQPEGFTIGINHGKISGQVIDHLHVHIVPRFKDDGGSSVHSVVNNPPKKSLAEIKNKLVKANK